MKKYLLVFLVSCVATFCHAQSDSLNSASKKMIGYTKNFWGIKYFVDGKQISRADVNDMLKNSPASQDEFKKYKNYNRATTYIGVAAMAFLITPLLTDNFKAINSPAGKTSAYVGFGLLIPFVIVGLEKEKYYGRAFNAYNQQFK